MKKLSLIFVLGLVIFAISCSQSTENAFLAKVAGKTATITGETSSLVFSADGKNFTWYSTTYSFMSADSESSATYTGYDSNYGYGTLTTTISVNGSTLMISETSSVYGTDTYTGTLY